MQTRPLLSDVPYGIPRVTGYATVRSGGGDSFTSRFPSLLEPGQRTPSYEDASRIEVYAYPDRRVYITVPVRNVGNGTALIDRVVFLLPDNGRVLGTTNSPVLPPGEIDDARLEVTEADDPVFSELFRYFDRDGEAHWHLSVVITYGDAGEHTTGAVRLDVASQERWARVRQLHWGDSEEDVIARPRISSRVRD